uniref:Uncharacterized protein n=1 Tax=Rhizophagus irregularis (strain DAOM 181602 / DAOM 197198 / MUCL 43194) TaxID=747089 RepID=U9V3W0_RHIID
MIKLQITYQSSGVINLLLKVRIFHKEQTPFFGIISLIVVYVGVRHLMLLIVNDIENFPLSIPDTPENYINNKKSILYLIFVILS